MKHLRRFNESFEDETKSYLETLFANISDSGYYNVNIEVIKTSVYVKLEPVMGKLWNRSPYGVTGFSETSIEDELEILRVKQSTLNSINAIIKDIESEGNEVNFITNRLGEIKINIDLFDQ
jgi:uncharacterized protein with ATP-grasp and redox domains